MADAGISASKTGKSHLPAHRGKHLIDMRLLLRWTGLLFALSLHRVCQGRAKGRSPLRTCVWPRAWLQSGLTDAPFWFWMGSRALSFGAHELEATPKHAACFRCDIKLHPEQGKRWAAESSV
tara:strand:- start:117 stop:482 length:366 start_codon:yes stop_codon:yes gene_type:complete